MSAQKGNLVMSRWRSGGKANESDYKPLKKDGMFYFISNDIDNIYIDIKVTDKLSQDKILKEGFTIWINMDDKQQKNLGVRYPIGSMNPINSRKNDASEGTINEDESLAGLLSMANTIELIGFISEQERHFPAENPDNFKGSVRIDNKGVLFYKMAMPISKLPIRNSRDGNGAMPFTVGFEFGFIPQMASSSKKSTARSSDSLWIGHVKLATSG